jgi:hypothetical protein
MLNGSCARQLVHDEPAKAPSQKATEACQRIALSLSAATACFCQLNNMEVIGIKSSLGRIRPGRASRAPTRASGATRQTRSGASRPTQASGGGRPIRGWRRRARSPPPIAAPDIRLESDKLALGVHPN